jgi:NodT family efflux transporter outer membrane factor (OMF) lipoprotein
VRRAALPPLTAAALLSACVATPKLAPPPTPLSAADVGPQQSLSGPAADWPKTGWWRAYGDPQLDALVDEGLRDAPSMAVAEARLRRAVALVGVASAAEWPSLNAGAAIAEAKPSYDTGLPTPPALHGWNDTGRAALDFAYEFDFWGKTRAAVAAASSEARASDADLAAARLALSTAIAATYADLARLYADRDVLEDAVKVRDATLDVVRRRRAAGFDSDAELHQAEAGPPAGRAELAAVDEQIALVRFRLADLVGAPPDRGTAIARPATTAPKSFGLPADLPAQLIARRPDVVAARRRAEAAAGRVDVAHAQFYPNVNLVGLIGSQTLGISNLFASGAAVGSVGGAVGLPIFDGGRRRAGYRVARAEYDAAVAGYDAAVLQALEDVAGVAASERALAARLDESRAALTAAERGWELARRRYEAGAADYPSVLIAEDRMLAARRVVRALEARAFGLDVALVRALGGGWTEPEARRRTADPA